MSVQILLSAVSDEFREYRDQLRGDLTRHNVAVKIEEDFKQGGRSTLELLDTYIRSCDAVVHLVGDMTGSRPKTPSIDYILTTYPGICDKLPIPRDRPGIADISYTQWEAWLAVYHGKVLFIAEADQNAPRGPAYIAVPESRASQRAHLEKLHSAERFQACKFKNPDDLAKHIAFGAILDLLAADLVNTRPAALVEPLVDMTAMTFVDLMRLTVVAASDAARIANEPRYLEFVDIADLHIAEQGTHITRIKDQISPDAMQMYLNVERHMSYLLVRLRRGPRLDRSWVDFSAILAKLALQVLELIEFLHPGRYSGELTEAGSAVHLTNSWEMRPSDRKSADWFVDHRFAAQSFFLEQIRAPDSQPLRTIRDDIDRRLAIPYFAIDATLLRAIHPRTNLHS
jgi:hypothetical protein